MKIYQISERNKSFSSQSFQHIRLCACRPKSFPRVSEAQTIPDWSPWRNSKSSLLRCTRIKFKFLRKLKWELTNTGKWIDASDSRQVWRSMTSVLTTVNKQYFLFIFPMLIFFAQSVWHFSPCTSHKYRFWSLKAVASHNDSLADGIDYVQFNTQCPSHQIWIHYNYPTYASVTTRARKKLASSALNTCNTQGRQLTKAIDDTLLQCFTAQRL